MRERERERETERETEGERQREREGGRRNILFHFFFWLDMILINLWN